MSIISSKFHSNLRPDKWRPFLKEVLGGNREMASLGRMLIRVSELVHTDSTESEELKGLFMAEG